jgi:hypothetical protein
VSCGVWPLAAGVGFKQVKVSLTPISKLKVPLPRFPLSHKDDEDDAGFLARVEQEARVIVGSYTSTEHEACIASLPNNGRLNHALKLAGVAYGPRQVPVSTEVLKKRKADATGKVLANCPKVHEKKRMEPMKVVAAHAKGGLKRSSDADISSAKSVKLSKSVIPHAIASVSKASVGGPSAKKRIILPIEALAAISLEGTQESSPHG